MFKLICVGCMNLLKPKSNPIQAKSKPVKPAKVKPVKAKPVSKAPQLYLSQLQIQPQANKTGIYITITCAGHPIHAFVLSVAEFGTWKCMASVQKVLFVRSRTNTEVFGNNLKIVNIVVNATINQYMRYLRDYRLKLREELDREFSSLF
jgi:hypothetical protein